LIFSGTLSAGMSVLFFSFKNKKCGFFSRKPN